MLVSTIALYGTEYKECDVDYIKLNQISWLKYNTKLFSSSSLMESMKF